MDAWRIAGALVALAVASPGSAQAQGTDEAERRKLEEQITTELGGKPPGAAPSAPAPAAARGGTAMAGAAPLGATDQGGATGGGSAWARLLLLPDISAIGSFALAYDGYDVGRLSPRDDLFGPAQKPKPLFEELELGVQSVIDPYARADIFISFTPEGVDVEEAYLTTLGLPAGFQVRAGQFFSPFGRLNTQHPHIWDFIDGPLARGRVLAGDVLSGPGVDVAWLAPLPWFVELHLAGQGTAPAASLDPSPAAGGERLTGIVRLLQYFTPSESTSVGVGFSAAGRDEGAGAFRDLGGADLYVKIRPLSTRAYLALQGELYARRFRDVAGVDRGTDWGAYAQAFWRRDAYWGYGVRWDRAPAALTAGEGEPAAAVPGAEQRLSAVAAWYLSEFQRVRVQAGWDRRPGGKDGLEALVHLEFGIGAHGAHPF